jgi:tetratricopeptide (TPR) repeat protein
MSRRLQWLALFVSFGLGVAGVFVFVGGIVVELVTARERLPVDDESLSPVVQLALGALCLAALMFLLWFTLVGWLLMRQSRQQGSGYGDAYRLIESFRFREAIPLLERSIREGKETAEVLMLLTSAYAYTGQLAKAQATADRSVRLFPNDPDAYITLANGYRLQAAYDEAARSLMRALELAPDQPVIWAELGFLQRFAGDETAALESFKHAANHAMPAMYGVRVYYHLTQAYQAVGEIKQAVRANAKMMSARSGLAAWKSGLSALEGTAYGQAMRYEIAAIEQALADADAGNLG